MSWLKKLASALGISKHEVAIVVVGLDNSGKTTLINHIRPKKVSYPIGYSSNIAPATV